MASAYKGDTARGDWTARHTAEATSTGAQLRQRPPPRAGDPERRTASGRSRASGHRGRRRSTFASRAIGYGIPGLRVDGNDFLAVYAAADWAAERARNNHGATLVELYTYRGEGHSTSDDPSRYRPSDEWKAWPLGDPIERLKRHLVGLGEWSEEQHTALGQEMADLVRETQKQAEAIGTLQGGEQSSPGTMFEDVFEETPWHIRRQRQQLGY